MATLPDYPVLLGVEGAEHNRAIFSAGGDDRWDKPLQALTRLGLVKTSGERIEFRSGFVGVVASTRGVLYILPKHYAQVAPFARPGKAIDPVPANTPELRKLARLYADAVLTYLRDSENARSTGEQVSQLGDFPTLMRTYEILNAYYLKFGIFKERVLAEDTNGKVNWSKTISRNEAIFSTWGEGAGVTSVLYPKPIYQRRVDVDGLVSHVFEVVLGLLGTMVGLMHETRHPLGGMHKMSQLMSELIRITNTQKAAVLDTLHRQIQRESGRRRHVVEALYSFIRCDGANIAKLSGNSCFVFGVEKFDRVWEAAVLKVMGGVRTSDEKVRAILNQPTFARKEDAIHEINTGDQRIDGYRGFDGVECDENGATGILFDAKYYAPGGANKRKFTLPLHDVMKQFMYHNSLDVQIRTTTINAFVLPMLSDTRIVEFAGTYSLCDLDEISVVVADIEAVFEHYAGNGSKGEMTCLITSICKREHEPPSAKPVPTPDAVEAEAVHQAVSQAEPEAMSHVGTEATSHQVAPQAEDEAAEPKAEATEPKAETGAAPQAEFESEAEVAAPQLLSFAGYKNHSVTVAVPRYEGHLLPQAVQIVAGSNILVPGLPAQKDIRQVILNYKKKFKISDSESSIKSEIYRIVADMNGHNTDFVMAGVASRRSNSADYQCGLVALTIVLNEFLANLDDVDSLDDYWDVKRH